VFQIAGGIIVISIDIERKVRIYSGRVAGCGGDISRATARACAVGVTTATGTDITEPGGVLIIGVGTKIIYRVEISRVGTIGGVDHDHVAAAGAVEVIRWVIAKRRVAGACVVTDDVPYTEYTMVGGRSCSVRNGPCGVGSGIACCNGGATAGVIGYAIIIVIGHGAAG